MGAFLSRQFQKSVPAQLLSAADLVAIAAPRRACQQIAMRDDMELQ
jgi:hypothetical protein